MTRNKNYALLLGATLALCGVLLTVVEPAAWAQSATAPTSQTTKSQKIIKMDFIVVHMMYQSLQVRSVTDFRDLRTFAYSPQIRDQMQQIRNSGGYQFGDKVTIWYGSDTTLALKIKGKPSGVK
jgi:hypothetical protein